MAGWRDFLAWIEGSALGVAVRESGLWTYAILNLFHIFGVSILFGSILLLDLHLIGVLRARVPLAGLSRVTEPVAKVGFTVAALTGIALLSTNATEYVDNPFLAIKFPAIGLGLLNVAILQRMPAWRARAHRELTLGEERRLAIVGATSLASWVAAMAAGRMIGYW